MKSIGIILVSMMLVTSFFVIFPIINLKASSSNMIFNPTDDTFIQEKAPDNQNGNIDFMWVKNKYGSSSADWEVDILIKFDISTISSQINIYSATLKLFYYQWIDNNPQGRELNLYRITEDWDEDTTTWNIQPSCASSSTASSIVPSTYQWMEWDVTDDVQDMVDGVIDNYGWEIKDENYWGSSNIPMTLFRPKEYGSYIPFLEIEVASPDIVYVDDDFDSSTSGWQYDHFNIIQEGIDAVTEGGTVYVYNGIYYENIVINKDNIDLIGEDKYNTIIDGGGSGKVVRIISDFVSLSGFNIKNSVDEDGIQLYYSQYHTVSDNIISQCWDGISLDHSSNNIVKNNMVMDHIDDGITLKKSNDNIINDNIMTQNNDRGYSQKDSYRNCIFNNLISYNGYAVYFYWTNSQNLFYHNTMIGNAHNRYFDYGVNSWDNNYPSGGNYWDDYTGSDNYHGTNQDIPGPDGKGDTPYYINWGGNQDNYPFINPYGWENPLIVDINIDIKPGDYPNTINPRSKGKIPVAIFTTEDFNANEVISDSIDFLSASPTMVAMDDVDNDGDVDLLLHFKIQELNFELLVDEGDEYPFAYLTGETNYGVLIEGKDTVRLVGPKFLHRILEVLLEKLIQCFPFFEKILNQII